MLNNIVVCDESQEEEKKFGGYNHPLPNMKEITVAEFSHHPFFTYGPAMYGYRQIMPENLPASIKAPTNGGRPCMMDVMFFVLYDGSGIAMHREYTDETVRYFSFAACEHSYRYPTEEEFAKGVPRPARCFHVSICSKCSHVYAVDSSD